MNNAFVGTARNAKSALSYFFESLLLWDNTVIQYRSIKVNMHVLMNKQMKMILLPSSRYRVMARRRSPVRG